MYRPEHFFSEFTGDSLLSIGHRADCHTVVRGELGLATAVCGASLDGGGARGVAFPLLHRVLVQGQDMCSYHILQHKSIIMRSLITELYLE